MTSAWKVLMNDITLGIIQFLASSIIFLFKREHILRTESFPQPLVKGWWGAYLAYKLHTVAGLLIDNSTFWWTQLSMWLHTLSPEDNLIFISCKNEFFFELELMGKVQKFSNHE